jgi:predicted metallo-beta-lactamase superfamily hydrolase
MENSDINLRFPEGKQYTYGRTKIHFSKPLFHGIEYTRVGWVFATIVEYNGGKLLHSSDVSGPMIEDYAEYIIHENPTFLIIDGPPTYLFGYILNRINLERTIDNMCKILRETDTSVILFDHHLTREIRYRDRTERVWKTAKFLGKKLVSAAEFLDQENILDTIKE